MSQWVNFDKLVSTHNLDPDHLKIQIVKLANTSKLIEGKDLQYLVLRNSCLTNSKLYNMKILPTPECTLCLHPKQDSAHRFYSCQFIKPVWDFLSDISKDTTIAHNFTFSCAINNVMNEPKNHPLTLLTNYTRLIINRDHINNFKIHPNTFLHKIFNLSDIFCANDQKYQKIWAEIGEKCRQMLKPFNPQILQS